MEPAARITLPEFKAADLRTASILHAAPVPGSKKLLKLMVDMGGEERQILAGIASSYVPETLVGKTVIVVANLEPKTLAGLESNGMVLAATREDGAVVLLTTDQPVAPGSKIS